MLGAVQVRLRRVMARRRSGVLDAATLERQRLAALFVVALFKLLNFFGGNWDVQWHVAIGRDSLWIPPHLLVLTAFSGGLLIALAWIIYESELARSGHALLYTLRIGTLEAPAPFWGVLAGYLAALNSGGFDELWHRAFGIDATLWSPPHLCIMASTMFVDLCLITGLATHARRLGAQFVPGSPLFWGVGLAGAFLFEAVNFQMSQALVESFRVQGAGVMGLLYPILVGALYPFPLLLAVRIARRFSAGLLIFGIAFALQVSGIGIAAAGFAILQPESAMAEFIRLNPDSSIAAAGALIAAVGFPGWVGVGQAWTLALSALPLALVALLERSARARQHPLIAAPVYSASLVATTFVWFKFIPTLRDFPIGAADLALAMLISAAAGTAFGALGVRLARVVPEPS